jgi:hypothetical protein
MNLSSLYVQFNSRCSHASGDMGSTMIEIFCGFCLNAQFIHIIIQIDASSAVTRHHVLLLPINPHVLMKCKAQKSTQHYVNFMAFEALICAGRTAERTTSCYTYATRVYPFWSWTAVKQVLWIKSSEIPSKYFMVMGSLALSGSGEVENRKSNPVPAYL